MREKWLGKFLDLQEGIARYDVYRQVLSAIRSELLETCCMNWVRDIKREVIAVEEKTMRGMAAKAVSRRGRRRNRFIW